MMITVSRGLLMCTLATALAAAAPPVTRAETPGEIPKPWTYEGSKKLQEQEQQQPSTAPGQGGTGHARWRAWFVWR